MPTAAILVSIIVLPFLSAVASTLLPTHARDAAARLAGGTAIIVLVLVASLYGSVGDGALVRREWAWMPTLGLSFVLRMDGFAWLFAALIAGIGGLVVLYSRYYMSAEDPVPRFFAFLLAFMGSMLGIVLSGNLIQLSFFWELTSLFSFLLIGYWHHSAAAREGARMALVVTGAGGLFLFAGFMVIGSIVGSYDLDVVLASGDRIREHPLYVPALVMVLLGALTKSAQFPFHFWLPHAMAAPTPVSAYLHSATLVKAGVFLMARLWPVMAGTDAWFWIVGASGLITLLIGAYVAVFQNDMKGLLAYSTISHLGLITLLLGLNTQLGMVAAIFHLMNHAMFKASLFMAAGIIDHETGTRDIRKLSGLRRTMPFTARLAMVAAAAMAGVPLLNGFLSKEMFFEEAIAAPSPYPGLVDALPIVAMIASAFSVVYSLRFIHGAFFGGDAKDLPREPREPPGFMRFPVEILVLACIAIGVLPSATIGPLLHTAAQAILQDATPVYSLAIWHGFTLPLMMSALAFGAGVLLYVILQRRAFDVMDGPPLLRAFDARRLFERALVGLSWRVARPLEALVGTRRLQPQLRLVVLVAVLAAVAAVIMRGVGPGNLAASPLDPVLVAIWLIGGAFALAAAGFAKLHRLAALVCLGGVGLATCMTFVWFSAPDLALTQLLVEVVTTVLLLLGLRWLPIRRMSPGVKSPEVVSMPRRLQDLAIAIAAGSGLGAIAYLVMTRTPPELLAQPFLARAYTEGGGRNVVNVILVDFRGFDTLGEITVLVIVALTTYALLRRFRPATDSVDVPEQQREQAAYDDAHPRRRSGEIVADWLMVPSNIGRVLFPVIALFSVFLLVRGHDLPGGGFAAGLTASIGLILQYMIGGTQWIEGRLRVLPLKWMGFGLLFATATGAAAMLVGRPFLTTYFAYADLPLLGAVPMASALIFDAGVFMVVIGATALILIALAHQSVRAHRSAPAKQEPRAFEALGGE